MFLAVLVPGVQHGCGVEAEEVPSGVTVGGLPPGPAPALVATGGLWPFPASRLSVVMVAGPLHIFHFSKSPGFTGFEP